MAVALAVALHYIDNCMKYHLTKCSMCFNLELQKVSTADGTHKLSMGVNGHIPGPPIVVYENTEVLCCIYTTLVIMSQQFFLATYCFPPFFFIV